MVVRSLPLSQLPCPDVANLAIMGIRIPLTCLISVVLDLGVEGGDEPADGLIRIGMVRENGALG